MLGKAALKLTAATSTKHIAKAILMERAGLVQSIVVVCGA